MKKLTFLLGMTLVMVSCGENEQEKVCECSKLYDKISAQADKAEEAGEDWSDARKAATAKHEEELKECETFHKELGDNKFHEMSKNCK